MSQSFPPDDPIPNAEIVASAPNPSQSNPAQSYVPQVLPPPKETGFGVAGFIASIIGIITCGSLSIFGVILSAIGLRKEPKGLAVAGLILGLIGLVELVGCGFLAYAGYQTAQSVGDSLNQIGVRTQLQQEATEIAQKWEEDEAIPSQADGDDMTASTSDLWGNPIAYVTDGATFSIRSSGPDGISFTEDDIVVGPFADAESAKVSPFGDFGGDFGDLELPDPDGIDLKDFDLEELEDMNIEGVDLEQIKKQMEKVQKAIDESNDN